MSKIHDDCWKNVTVRVMIRFSADLARWPSFWPKVTQFRIWPRNHQDKHFGQDSWWLLKQVTPMLPSKFGVNWSFGSGKKRKIDFQDDCHGGHLGILIGMILAILIYKSPQCFLASFKSIGFSVQKKRNIDYQDGSHLGFPNGTILAIFNLQVTPMLPSKFGVNWPFSSEEEAKK